MLEEHKKSKNLMTFLGIFETCLYVPNTKLNQLIMGHLKEPKGVDFFVDPTPLSKEDRQQISEIIAYYKRTGKKMPAKKTTSRKKIARQKNSTVA